MTSPAVTRAFRSLYRLAQTGHDQDQTDAALLDRFVRDRDEAAFAILVRRHGPMVLNVCRRVLRHEHDAEDAFQAAFLVLARKAACLRRRESAGGWLFRVAYNLALKMKTTARPRQTDLLALESLAGPVTAADDSDLRCALDAELDRLPEKYREPVLLCHVQGLTYAAAARRLGWKLGAVKIRLERARALLRQRLTRRGLAGAAVGLLLDATPATAALPAGLVESTVTTAVAYVQGALTIVSPAFALAQGVLHTMTIYRLQRAVFVLFLVLGLVGGAAYAALADRAPPEDEPVAVLQAQAVAEPVAAPAPPGPLRVLLFAGGPTKELQFLRRLFAQEGERRRAELSLCIQDAAPGAVHEVPAERLLREFPEFHEKPLDDAEKKYSNLLMYDVVIALDADWSRLEAKQLSGLARWVKERRGGLILVAGPINTFQLARAVNQEKLQPVIDLCPVRLDDSRLLFNERPSPRPCTLNFPGAKPEMRFLKLDAGGEGPLAGWSDFFYGRPAKDAKPEPVLRGFYNYYPIRDFKNGAQVVATFSAPEARIAPGNAQPFDQPYLVTASAGKGRVVYVSSGEFWRLRQFNGSFYERFWDGLARYAADAPPSAIKSQTHQALTPEESKAIAAGLDYLAKEQHRDGHWEGKGGVYPVAFTALAGRAFLMDGNTLAEGKHAERIRRAVDFLVERCQRNGLITNPNNPNEAAHYMIGHGHALFFLACVHGEEEDGERRKKLQEVLGRAVDFSGRAQTTKGGWGFVAAADGDDFADPAATLTQLHALYAARCAGIPVPKEVIDKAQLYLVKAIKSDDPLAPALAALTLHPTYPDTALAEVALAGGRAAVSVAVKRWGQGLEAQDTYFAQAVLAYRLGETGHLQLRPKTLAEQRITWSRYRQDVFAGIQKEQNQDGSWEDGLGKVHRTASMLAILQLENAVLPVLQR